MANQKQEPKKSKKIIDKKIIDKKVDLKKENKDLWEKNKKLEIKITNLEAEIQKNLIEFQVLAKSFQAKAQKQIDAAVSEKLTKIEKDQKIIKKYGSQKLLESIIEPILSIEQAVEAGKKDDSVSAYVMGFEMLLIQLYSELETFGVTKIKPNVGEEFNPELHYVMSQENGGKSNTIKEVKKSGFKYYDRVLKPATVITFK